MRTNLGRIFGFFPRLLVEFLPGLFVDLFRRLVRRHEINYFVADEVVFQISHPAGTPPDVTLNAVRTFLPFNKNFFQEAYVSLIPAAGNDWRNRLKPPPESPTPNPRIITISSAEPFSLVPVRVAWHSRSGLRSAAVSRVLQVAYTQLQSGPIDLGNGISLQTISPNWFAKNLHHSGNTGGPGSWPVEAVEPQTLGTGVAALSEHEFRLVGSMQSLKPYKDRIPEGEVHVAILDTVPLGDFQQVAQSVVQQPSVVASASSPLIRYLFLQNLDIHRYINPTNPNELTDLLVYTPRPYHYQMADHGTFIAGIIHTIAPGATIHLYEVLNSFGLGTLTSVAQSLIDAVNDHNKRGDMPLIINCSFVLDFVTPTDESTLSKLLNLTNPQISVLSTKSILGVLNWITSLNNVVVVAAAGNEAKPGVRPYAYYPAAFQGVIGVGALPRNNPISNYPSGQYYIPASYSNFSYDPQNKLPRDGFMTFGGELDNPQSPQSIIQPFASQGVLGVYMGEFPSRNTANGPITQNRAPSPTGWAHWAGTSFAAPIITGLLAVQSANASISTATPAPAVPPLTAEGENVILVRQG